MKKSTRLLSLLLVSIATLVWFTGSWWYYTCKIKNTCDATALASLPNPIDNKNNTSPVIETTAKVVIDTDGDGLSNDEEKRLKTDPLLIDTDRDGIPDNQEVGTALDKPLDSDQDGIIDALDNDDDNDGLPTRIEEQIGSSPLLNDTDEDGMLDAEEVGNSPETPLDTDGDGIVNVLDTDDDDDGLETSDEILLGTNPLLADTDGDGLTDLAEVGEYLDHPLDSDADGTIDALDTEDNLDQDNDGIPNKLEALLNTNPNKADTDGDGIDDLTEVGPDLTSPLDSDLDGIIDALDTSNDADSDNDGLTDQQELTLKSNPESVDSDGDGINDYLEIGSDINDPLDTDADGILNLNDPDDDNDQLNTRYESRIGTNPLRQDSDGDTLSDFQELGNTDKNNILDTDNDGKINPIDPDDDNDAIPTKVELRLGTNPLLADTDHDGQTDASEIGDDFEHPLDTDKNGVIDALDPQSAKMVDKLAEQETKPAVAEATPVSSLSKPGIASNDKELKETSPKASKLNPTDTNEEQTATQAETPNTADNASSKLSMERINNTEHAGDNKEAFQASRLYFPFSSANPELTDETLAYFKKIVQWMQQSPQNIISLTGHTDSIGTKQANLAMGIRRVMVIRKILIDLGAPFKQIEVLSRGESEPIASNDNPAGRLKNRRVEIAPFLPGKQ